MQIAAIRSTASNTRGRHCKNTHHGRTRNQGVKRLLSNFNVAFSEKKGGRLRMTLKYARRQHPYVVAVVFAAIRVFSRITKGSLLVV